MLPIISFIFAVAIVLYFVLEQRKHDAKILSVKYRIHVNGIRGKSSVTRLIAGVLREAKIKTIAKATGSDTNIITHEGEDLKVDRKGPANVFENVRMINKHVGTDVEAVVFECMAIRPQFQRFLEKKVIKSNIGIITNIREDHVEELGHTFEKIAMSLSSTIPVNGHLICADENKKVQKILKAECKKKNTKFINALKFKVSDDYINNFSYFEHKENISVGLAVADLLNIPRRTALKGMKKIVPDMGAVSIKKYNMLDKTVIWTNLFAANDRQSVVKCADMIMKQFKGTKPATVCLLNNRTDRPERAKQFSDMLTNDLAFDYVATIGELQKQVIHKLKKNNKIISLAHEKDMDGESLVAAMIKPVEKEKVLILGMGNIHTRQAELIMDYFTYDAKEVN